jgi:GT2 family glycosyltransferase
MIGTTVESECKIGIVIPTYRRGEALIQCIQSARTGSVLAFDVVVINDGGDPAVSDLLRQHCPNVIEITSTCNLWWTKSVNLGLEYLIAHGYSAAILLNDDVTVAPGFVDNMVMTHRQNPEAIIISKIVDQHDQIWALGGYTSWPFVGESLLFTSPSPSATSYKITWSPGMGTLIPLLVVESIGLLDDRAMPQYLSDADFGLRATRSGWKIILNQDCVVRNDTRTTGGVSGKRRLHLRDLYFNFFDRRSADYLRARVTFIYRHAPFGLRTVSVFIRIAKVLLYFIKRIV